MMMTMTMIHIDDDDADMMMMIDDWMRWQRTHYEPFHDGEASAKKV